MTMMQSADVECSLCGDEFFTNIPYGKKPSQCSSPCHECVRKEAYLERCYAVEKLPRDQERTIASMRDVFAGMAMYIMDEVPKGREQDAALAKLEEAMFWANAGTARKTSKA